MDEPKKDQPIETPPLEEPAAPQNDNVQTEAVEVTTEETPQTAQEEVSAAVSEPEVPSLEEQPTTSVEEAPAVDTEAVVTPQNQDNIIAPVTLSITKKQTSGRKKVVIWLIALVAAVAVGVGVYLLLQNNQDNSSEQTGQSSQQAVTLGAAVVLIEGTVETSSDGASWSAAEKGQSLANLDYVRTGSDGRAIVLFDNGSVTRLNNNSTVYLSSLTPEALEITLVEGETYNRVVKSDSQTYTVVTANERFQALGTAYNTSTNGDADVLSVYESDVKVVSTDVKVDEGNQYSTKNKKSTSIDLEKLSKDKFAQWNKKKDSEIDEFKNDLGVLDDKIEKDTTTSEQTTQPSNTSTPNASISLSGNKVGNGVQLNWSVSGLSAPKGFKIVRDAQNAAPTFGVHESLYVSESAARSATWYDENGGSFYYRVCVYTGSGCVNYSNAVRVTSPKIEKAPVVSGGINLSINGNKLSWSLSGGTAPYGYKVVLSSSAGPVYPQHSIIYSDTTSATLPDKPAGTYYVRVCKFTSGTQTAGCVDYSNQVNYVVTAG